MFINGPILTQKLSGVEAYSAAMEADQKLLNTITHNQKVEYTLKDKYFPYIESFLPKTENILFRHIMKYEDKNADILNSPYLVKILPFGENEKGEDYDIVYRCTRIDPEELRDDIKKVPLPGNATEKAAFLPFQVTLYLIIRYYFFTKQPKKLKPIYNYYGYSIYWKRFNKSWNKFPPVEAIMIYTINEMSYRNKIKSLGSLKGLLEDCVQHIFEHYYPGVIQSCDEDIRYILDQVQSGIGSKINAIATKYYDNYYDPDKKKMIMTGDTFVDNEGTQRKESSISASVETLSQKFANKFYAETVDRSRLKTAVTMSGGASLREVGDTLDYIIGNIPPADVREFYEAIFMYYLSLDDPQATTDSVQSLKFMALMRDVIKKGNTLNKNVKTIIKFTNEWLDHGSNTFRLTTRDGTKTNYRKAVYLYFILLVTNH